MPQTEKLTRKDLKEMVKHDTFREKTLETVGYVSEHRSQVAKYAIAALVVLLLGGAIWFYRSYQHTVRQEALGVALQEYGAMVGAEKPTFAIKWYKTAEEKNAAIKRVFSDLAAKYAGTEEGLIANYYLGIQASDQGNAADAEKYLKLASEGDSAYASLAKLSLSQVYKSQGKIKEAEQLIRAVIAKPTPFVSKEAATIELARLLATSNPAEARKLLEPLRSERSNISRAALTLLSELQK